MDYRLATLEDTGELLRQIDAAERLAVDTEFHIERRYLPRLFLVQVHVEGGETWILDPLEKGLLDAVGTALVSRPWVVHAGLYDLRLLHRALGALPETVLDTQLAGGLVEARWPRSLAGLLEDKLDVSLAKSATLSDWSQRPLDPRQLQYAAEDVHLLLPLYAALETELVARGREGMFAAACAELRERGETLDPVEEAWRGLRATNVLSPREACVLQELCAWREERAREQDVPPRSVVSDGALVDLTRNRPLSVKVLSQNRRFPKQVLRKHGTELLEVMQRAWQRPEWAWPQPVRRYHASTRLRLLLDLFAETDGRDHDYGPRLGLPEALRDDLAVSWPGSRDDLAGVLGWRDPLLGDRLFALCRGGLVLQASGDDTSLSAPD